MTLMERIKEAQLIARKARSTDAAVLTTLIGEAAMIGKNDGGRETSDAEVIAVIKKFIKNIDETIANLKMTQYETAIALTNEKMVLEAFLPTQFTPERLRGVLESIKDEISAGP